MSNTKIQIKWLGQSGYLLSVGETVICIDPYLSDSVEKVSGKRRMCDAPIQPKDLTADIFICTHDHLDHLDPDTLSQLDCPHALFLAPADCQEHLKKLGIKNAKVFDKGDVYSEESFNIKAVFADHTVPAIGVIVEADGKKMYFSGDTYYNEKLKDISGIDLMFICINGKLGNMNVDEAIRLTKEIKPAVAVPNHYGMFAENTENPEIFTSGVECGYILEFNKNYSLEQILERKI